jgi:hypothetical protein
MHPDDEKKARKERAARLRGEIERLKGGPRRPPATPRELTDRAARERAGEARPEGQVDPEGGFER